MFFIIWLIVHNNSIFFSSQHSSMCLNIYIYIFRLHLFLSQSCALYFFCSEKFSCKYFEMWCFEFMTRRSASFAQHGNHLSQRKDWRITCEFIYYISMSLFGNKRRIEHYNWKFLMQNNETQLFKLVTFLGLSLFHFLHFPSSFPSPHIALYLSPFLYFTCSSLYFTLFLALCLSTQHHSIDVMNSEHTPATVSKES